MDKTTNFDLPQWVKADQIKMDDFNGAFASIDAALKAEGDARSEADGTAAERITALAQTIANGKICRIKYGSYTGNGKYGAANAVSSVISTSRHASARAGLTFLNLKLFMILQPSALTSASPACRRC